MIYIQSLLFRDNYSLIGCRLFFLEKYIELFSFFLKMRKLMASFAKKNNPKVLLPVLMF